MFSGIQFRLNHSAGPFKEVDSIQTKGMRNRTVMPARSTHTIALPKSNPLPRGGAVRVSIRTAGCSTAVSIPISSLCLVDQARASTLGFVVDPPPRQQQLQASD